MGFTIQISTDLTEPGFLRLTVDVKGISRDEDDKPCMYSVPYEHERQRQGIAAATARGVRFGRPCWKPTTAFIAAVEAAKCGELPWNKAARDFGMSESNFRYHAKTFIPRDLGCS